MNDKFINVYNALLALLFSFTAIVEILNSVYACGPLPSFIPYSQGFFRFLVVSLPFLLFITSAIGVALNDWTVKKTSLVMLTLSIVMIVAGLYFVPVCVG